jgi:hypothetical protein
MKYDGRPHQALVACNGGPLLGCFRHRSCDCHRSDPAGAAVECDPTVLLLPIMVCKPSSIMTSDCVGGC